MKDTEWWQKILLKYSSGEKIKEDEMAGEYGTSGEEQKCWQGIGEKNVLEEEVAK